MKKTVVLAFFIVVGRTAFTQKDVTAVASVDKTSILIGEPLQLTLEATFSKSHTVSFFALDSLPHFEILNRSKIDTLAAPNATTVKQTVTLTSWDSGAWLVPALSIAGVKRVVTKPVVVNVTFTPMPPNQDYHDVKDIIDVQKPPRTTWYWYLIGAVLLLLFLRLLFPTKKKNVAAEAPVIREGAYKQALKELDVLKSKTALDDKTYFTELIQIFRAYLQQGKGIHSFQQTTGDLSRQLQTLPLPDADFKNLVQALQLSDFAKFARYTARAEEREQAWTEIRKSILAIEPIQI